MSLLLEALDAPAAADSHLICHSDGSGAKTGAEISTLARRASANLRRQCGASPTVAVLMAATHDCVSTAFGALRSGATLVSLPTPARGMPIDEYIGQLNAMCSTTGATHLYTDAAYVDFLGEVDVPVAGFHELTGSGDWSEDHTPGRLVQFTSGSTGGAKGIELTLDAIEANLTSMYGWLPPLPDATGCNWLPLSHDMGLVGFVLNTIGSFAPPWSMRADLHLIAPEDFMRDPSIWLTTCSEFGVTSTSAPPFALRMAMRALRTGKFDLSSLRTFVVGSEPVPAEGVRAFEAAAFEHGLSANAICPGYGLAEATLAVAIDDRLSPWRTVRVDRGALGEGAWRPTDGPDGLEMVSCGMPLPGVELRLEGEGDFGQLAVRSGSLLSGYVGQTTTPVSADGWFTTSDLAHLEGGELFVSGRVDDVLIVAGRNLDARAIDEVAGSHDACRPGNAASVPDDEGRYVVILEPNVSGSDTDALRAAARDIRVALTRRFSASPSAVLFIERGTLPKTPSGKVRRNHLRRQWQNGELALVAQG